MAKVLLARPLFAAGKFFPRGEAELPEGINLPSTARLLKGDEPPPEDKRKKSNAAQPQTMKEAADLMEPLLPLEGLAPSQVSPKE